MKVSGEKWPEFVENINFPWIFETKNQIFNFNELVMLLTKVELKF